MCSMPECDQTPISIQIPTNVKLGTVSVILSICPICDTRRCGASIEVAPANGGPNRRQPCGAQVFDRFAKKCPREHDLSLSL